MNNTWFKGRHVRKNDCGKIIQRSPDCIWYLDNKLILFLDLGVNLKWQKYSQDDGQQRWNPRRQYMYIETLYINTHEIHSYNCSFVGSLAKKIELVREGEVWLFNEKIQRKLYIHTPLSYSALRLQKIMKATNKGLPNIDHWLTNKGVNLKVSPTWQRNLK